MVEDAADELALGRGDRCPERGRAFDYGEPLGMSWRWRCGKAVVEEGTHRGVGRGNEADEAACEWRI